MYFYFEEAEYWMKRKQEIFHKINQTGLPLVLFGKAPAVSSAFLNELKIPVQYICDNNPEIWGTKLWGLEFISPDQLRTTYRAYNVLILVPFESEIVPQLKELPVPPVEIFYLDLYFEEDGSAGFFREMQPAIEEIYNCLADQESKETYESVIQYRINRNPGLLSRIAVPRAQQYFSAPIDNTSLRDSEVFVDAGAFTGDTVASFLSAVNGQYDSIYAFEPNPENYRRLMKNTQNVQNIVCRQVGVGDHVQEIRFNFDESSSKADASGEQMIQVDTLDHLLGDTPVTYIKMDVEGMECAALRGAKSVIQTHRPKLAICTYHSNADMVLVPKLILELNPDYQLYFRHYTHALVETVCYAM